MAHRGELFTGSASSSASESAIRSARAAGTPGSAISNRLEGRPGSVKAESARAAGTPSGLFPRTTTGQTISRPGEPLGPDLLFHIDSSEPLECLGLVSNSPNAAD